MRGGEVVRLDLPGRSNTEQSIDSVDEDDDKKLIPDVSEDRSIEAIFPAMSQCKCISVFPQRAGTDEGVVDGEYLWREEDKMEWNKFDHNAFEVRIPKDLLCEVAVKNYEADAKKLRLTVAPFRMKSNPAGPFRFQFKSQQAVRDFVLGGAAGPEEARILGTFCGSRPAAAVVAGGDGSEEGLGLGVPGLGGDAADSGSAVDGAEDAFERRVVPRLQMGDSDTALQDRQTGERKSHSLRRSNANGGH
jgi:hypothetical protein